MPLTLSATSKFPVIQRKWTTVILKGFCICLAVFVYLSHLGYLPLDIESDEARRALVTSEMMLSGNYITPTINGDIYLNKPPLYNYVVAGYFKLFGNYSMFAFRLQCIVAVIITGFVIYYFVNKFVGKYVAFFSAIAYATNGRFILYESLYGMIDTTFSLLVFLNFMLIFYYGEQKKYYHLFICSYVATALAFLMKGMPAVVFQAITLFAFFAWKRKLKLLWSAGHIYGIAAFLLILVPYYFIFFSHNNLTVATVFSTLFSESEKRTFLEYDAFTLLQHILSFPGEIFYHFLPWTIFLIALLRRDCLRIIREHPFIHYITIIFIANIIVYWVSPDVYPKYLFMFVPLIYIVGFYFYFHELKKNSWQKKLINIILAGSCLVVGVSSFAIPVTKLATVTTTPYLKAGFLIAGLLCCFYMSIKGRYRLYAFIVALLICREGFNWFVLEQRGQRFFDAEYASDIIAEKTNNKPLYILETADTKNFDGFSFEISTKRNEILRRSDQIIPGAYYIADSAALKNNKLIKDLSFENLPAHNILFLAHTPQEPAIDHLVDEPLHNPQIFMLMALGLPGIPGGFGIYWRPALQVAN